MNFFCPQFLPGNSVNFLKTREESLVAPTNNIPAWHPILPITIHQFASLCAYYRIVNVLAAKNWVFRMPSREERNAR
jgi:hypothetical protein